MPRPRVWLLLVGIDFYPNKGNRLHGAVNDVSNIELALKDYYNEINVIKLLASVSGEPGHIAPPEEQHLWPSWDNFNDKIEGIMEKASAHDIVWIHYSGHGTLRPTINSGFFYQEGYGTDAALVLLEPNGQEEARYLRGIELALLLNKMVNKKLKVTVVLDSCHSGSISRGERSEVRGMPWSADVDSEFPLHPRVLPHFLTSKQKALRDTAITSHWLLHPQGYTLLAACGPHERAKEINIKEKQQQRGALSYMICIALDFCAQNKIENITHELIYRHVYASMFKIAGQHPILIGSEKTSLWGAEVARLDARSSFEIVKVSADQQIWLNARLVHGVCTGDEYEVYTHAEAEELVARIVITDVEAVHAVAKHTSPMRQEDDYQIKVEYRTILTKLARPRACVKLFPGANGAWGDGLKESTWLQHLRSDELAPVDIPCFSVVQSDNHQYSILDSKNDAILNLPSLISSNPSVGDKIFTILEHLSKYTFVQLLDNRRTNSLTDIDFSITVKAQADHLNHSDSGSSITIPHNSKVDIEFQNLTQEVLHFTVLNLTPLRRIKRLYPAHKEYQSVMPRNLQKVLSEEIPDIAPPGVDRLSPRLTVPARLSAQRQGSVVAEDVLKFIVSTYPVRGTRNMELPDLFYAVEHSTAAIRSTDETFTAPVQESLVEKGTGLGQFEDGTPMTKWACRSITIRTVLEAS